MKHVCITVMCMMIGVVTGLYLSQYLTPLLPETAENSIKQAHAIVFSER